MKNKRGFTLVEMLGVLIILAIIFIIAFPAITTMIRDTNSEIDEATVSILESATSDYLYEKKDVYPKNSEYVYCIGIEDLINNGNLSEKEIPNLAENLKYIKTTFEEDNTPVYEIVESCETVYWTVNFELNGDKNVTIEVDKNNSPENMYKEQGAKVIKKDSNGNDEVININAPYKIVNSQKKEVSLTTGINIRDIETYTLTYRATVDGEDYYLERIVRIIDTTAPVITIDAGSLNQVISITSTTYNSQAGVSVDDNSGESIVPIVRTNLSLGRAGTYTVTYIATDSSGNSSSISKTVTVSNGNLVKINLGQKVVYHELSAGEYVEPRVTAQDLAGNDLTSELEVTIRRENQIVSAIIVNRPTTYYITYSIVKDKVTYSETRTVIITGYTVTTGITVYRDSSSTGASFNSYEVDVVSNVSEDETITLENKYRNILFDLYFLEQNVGDLFSGDSYYYYKITCVDQNSKSVNPFFSISDDITVRENLGSNSSGYLDFRDATHSIIYAGLKIPSNTSGKDVTYNVTIEAGARQSGALTYSSNSTGIQLVSNNEYAYFEDSKKINFKIIIRSE